MEFLALVRVGDTHTRAVLESSISNTLNPSLTRTYAACEHAAPMNLVARLDMEQHICKHARISAAEADVSGYLVSNHVHVCATPEAAILLDLRSDRYHGLAPAQSQSLATIVEGWPRLGTAMDPGDCEPLPLAKEMVERGLLTRDPSRGRPLAPVQLPQVEAHLCDWDSDRWPRVQVSHAIHLGVACMRTLAQLRFSGMERTADYVRARKANQSEAGGRDVSVIRDLTYTYRALRPFFYTVRERCLYDSLVLMHYLTAHGVYPTWVIGVKPNPFSAHSWVQAGSHVLNSPPDYVRGFIPILAI